MESRSKTSGPAATDAAIRVLEGAEEFALGDGPTGALLVHGYTGSPQSMRPLGEYLAERGVAVLGPRLPGHGTTWEDLAPTTHADWTDAVETAFTRMAAERDEVFLVGLSFGGALCLDLAARYPDRVAGIVTLAGFVRSHDPRRFFARTIRRLVRSVPGVANDIADPDQREIAYDRLPTTSTYWMLRFLRRARMGLAAVTSPILVVHSRNDHTVHPSNANLIYDSVSSEDKEIVWLDRSYHVITLDMDRDEVFRRTFEFIRDRARNAV